MAYRYGNREQEMNWPPRIEEWMPADAPVRAYDAIVEALDWDALDIEYNPDKVGSPEYDPKTMLKLLVYGYAYGVRSSRKLEREVNYNLAFIWLMGGLKPDHKTIAEFRRRHREALKQVIRECARLCRRLGLIGGETLYVDGSKMRANASIDKSWDEKKCAEHLQQLQTRVEEILAECERVDREESGQDSWVQLREELADRERRIAEIERTQERLKQEEKTSLNRTDPECVRIKGRQGSHAGYNSQIAVDARHGLIVHSDVVNQNNDLGQLGAQVEQARAALPKSEVREGADSDGSPSPLDRPDSAAKPAGKIRVCADSGFCQYSDLRDLEKQGVEAIVPSKRQARGESDDPFEKARFVYEAERDAYRCPEGQRLERSKQRKDAVEYRAGPGVCPACPRFGSCTTSANGRQITRYRDEEYREELARRYDSPEGRAVYRRRKELAELPFGHIKRNLGAGHFLLRGLAGVRAEMSLLATAFNIARLITLQGVAVLRALPQTISGPPLREAV